MNNLEILKQRHSVRQYTDQPIEETSRNALQELIGEINAETGLHFQIFFDEPECFTGVLAHYGNFRGVNNYFCLVGKKNGRLEEDCGYYGQQLVMKAQELGLNTCWVALTYSKKKCRAVIDSGEKLVLTIALGHGCTAGVPHHSKNIEELADIPVNAPTWYREGVKAAELAPTAMNQQKFYITLQKDKAYISYAKGSYTKADCGIVRYCFEAVSEHQLIDR